MKKWILTFLLSLTLVFNVMASHYIRSGATGSADGSSWTNAFTDIPNTLIRGDTYYISGGNYAGHSFAPLAGSTYVYLKKANASDNGLESDYVQSYADNTAIFSSSTNVFTIRMAYLSIDGVTGSAKTGHGIRLVTTGTAQGSGATIYKYDEGGGHPCDHFTLKHVECSAPNPGANLSNFNIDFHEFPSADNLLIQYCYIHGGLVGVLFTGSNQIIEHSYLRYFGNPGGPGHAEIIDACNVQGLTIRYNVLEDLMLPATTYIEPQVNGGRVPNGIYIYGNIFRATVTGEGSTNPSVFSSTSNEVCTNVFIYNNTIYGLNSCTNQVGFADSGIWGSNNSSTITAQNNIWQSCVHNPGFGPGSSVTQDHNFLNTGTALFVNGDNGDFHLVANTSPGVTLVGAGTYDTDPDGKTRTTWSLGAYEYAPMISGKVYYCPNPTAPAISGVTVTLSGDASASTTTDSLGNYSFNNLTSGGNYVVTPSKADLASGSSGIDTVDAIALQRHFFEPFLTGCKLTAADVNADGRVNTVDVVAVSRFYLGSPTGFSNTGKHKFTPASTTYTGITAPQVNQNYSTLVYGDVAAPYVYGTTFSSPEPYRQCANVNPPADPVAAPAVPGPGLFYAGTASPIDSMIPFTENSNPSFIVNVADVALPAVDVSQ